MDELREQCPWDKKQTLQTLRQQTLEEVYELVDAISENDYKSLKEELGDLLLHIVFYSKIGAEQGQFTLDDVIEGVCNKLVSRHPHIYSTVLVNNEEDVKQNWEKLKLKEGKKSVLSGLPSALPELMKALRLQGKAKQVGFEWDHTHQVQAKVEEELQELYEAVANKNQAHIEEELGDVLFAIINYSRFVNVDPEQALGKTNKKFISRFQHMELLAEQEGKALYDMTLEEMDALWNKAKLAE
jgi:XTP/dITP diphosphohydrolase